MPYVRGFLNIVEGGGGGEIDNSLPGSQPGIDNGLPPLGPNYPNNGLPTPPPGIWPPPTPGNPIIPDNGLPGAPPGTIWPSPGRPDNALPLPPGVPDNTLPGSGTYWVVAGIPGIGWRYIAVDPSLRPGNELPSQPPPVATPH
jgi:hypothetical protein